MIESIERKWKNSVLLLQFWVFWLACLQMPAVHVLQKKKNRDDWKVLRLHLQKEMVVIKIKPYYHFLLKVGKQLGQ